MILNNELTGNHTDENVGVSIVIPAFDEEDGIADQIKQIQQVISFHTIPYEIIVVDDGSKDRTAERAALPGVRLLRHYENRGYGASLKTGIRAASHDKIIIIDADGTYPADQIPAMLTQLERSDLIVGARIGEKVHNQSARQPAKWLLRVLAARIAERDIPDLNSGMRAFRRECIQQYFPILSNRFSFTTTMTLAYLADDYHITYHPINYFPRSGKSKIVPRHFIDFLVLIIRISMIFNPLKVFVPMALFFGSLGILKTIYDVLAVFARSVNPGLDLFLQPVLSTSAVLLLFVGLQFLMIGMVADGVIRRIAQSNPPVAPSHGRLWKEVNRTNTRDDNSSG
jgi:glycosyltransferase involved in cell wall biosynthesis